MNLDYIWKGGSTFNIKFLLRISLTNVVNTLINKTLIFWVQLINKPYKLKYTFMYWFNYKYNFVHSLSHYSSKHKTKTSHTLLSFYTSFTITVHFILKNHSRKWTFIFTFRSRANSIQTKRIWTVFKSG